MAVGTAADTACFCASSNLVAGVGFVTGDGTALTTGFTTGSCFVSGASTETSAWIGASTVSSLTGLISAVLEVTFLGASKSIFPTFLGPSSFIFAFKTFLAASAF